jgi:hypothetical protein
VRRGGQRELGVGAEPGEGVGLRGVCGYAAGNKAAAFAAAVWSPFDGGGEAGLRPNHTVRNGKKGIAGPSKAPAKSSRPVEAELLAAAPPRPPAPMDMTDV